MGTGESGAAVVRRLREAVPTSRHAEMLFRMAVDLLGADGHVESAAEGKQLMLFRRARVGPESYVPWPLLHLCLGARQSWMMVPGQAPTREIRGSRGGDPVRGAGPGEVTVYDGPQRLTLTYGENGRWLEAARSASVEAFAGLVPVLERQSARPVELVADFVAGLDLARHGPGTVLMPTPLPCALRGVWGTGMRAIRHALFHARLPDDARWAAADCYAGTALAWGDTRAEALARWRAEVERVRPTPPSPATAPKPEDLPPGAFRISGPAADDPWPDPAPANTPAAVVPLDPPPPAAPPFGAWTRLLGGFGATVPAALRRDVAGFTLVGDKLLDALGPAGLARLDETLAEAPPLPPAKRPDGSDCPQRNSRAVRYRLADEETGEPVVPAAVGAWQSDEFDPRQLDGDELRWRVVRQRWLDLE